MRNIIYLIAYILIINLIGFILMYVDKKRSAQGQWRIPEKTLFGIAFIFGSIGVYLGIYTFRHKTKRPNFTFGIPIIFIINILCIYYIISNDLISVLNFL